jgi:hypothetical protein
MLKELFNYASLGERHENKASNLVEGNGNSIHIPQHSALLMPSDIIKVEVMLSEGR